MRKPFVYLKIKLKVFWEVSSARVLTMVGAESSAKEGDLLHQSTKKKKKNQTGHPIEHGKELGWRDTRGWATSVKSYKESLIGGDGRGDLEKTKDEDLMNENFDELSEEMDRVFNGFQIIEKMNGDRPWLAFLIFEEEERANHGGTHW